MIRKVLLVNPTNTMHKDSIRRIGEPIGLLYLGASLKQNGYKVYVFDMVCEGYDNCVYDGDRVVYGSSSEDFVKKLSEINPDIVGVSCMFTSREKNALDVCRIVKKTIPDIPVVVGGLHPSLFPARFLNSGYVEYVIMGEGEKRFVKLLECLNDKRLPEFDGVAYKSKDGIHVNPAHDKIDDLNTIPYPDRTLIDMEKYIEIGVPFAPFSHEQRVAQVLTTRGCPYSCNFCASFSYWGQKIRFRTADNVIGEIRELVEKYDIREIQFIDDNMTADKKFAKELFLKMKEFNIKFCTPNGLFLNSLDPEIIRLMAGSGAYQLTFAIESASRRVLKDIIHKNVNLDKVKPIIDEAHKYDISTHGMFIVGFPGETREEIMATLDFPFHVGFDSTSFFIVTPLPGSELYKECEEKGYLSDDYSVLDFKSTNINIPEDSEDYCIAPHELVKLVDETTRKFNEWAKKTYHDRWQKKYTRYLKNHPEQKDIVMGRIT